MPFEISPKFLPAVEDDRMVRFHRFSNAILRACAFTRPAPGHEACRFDYKAGGYSHACVWMAIGIGLGGQWEASRQYDPEYGAMQKAYRTRYESSYVDDYIHGRFTREQIAARIAAL